MSEYSQLKQLAQAATKGKWCTDGERQVMSAESDQLNNGFVIVDCQGPDNLKNAAFIAAANPAAVLALIAENEALRKEAERYQWLRDKSDSVHQFYLSTPIWFTGVKFSKEMVDSTIDSAMSKEVTP